MIDNGWTRLALLYNLLSCVGTFKQCSNPKKCNCIKSNNNDNNKVQSNCNTLKVTVYRCNCIISVTWETQETPDDLSESEEGRWQTSSLTTLFTIVYCIMLTRDGTRLFIPTINSYDSTLLHVIVNQLYYI